MKKKPEKFRFTLRKKFTLYIGGLLLVTGMVMFLFGFRYIKNTVTNMTVKRNLALVQSYALSAETKLAMHDDLALDDESALFGREEGVVAAYILDSEGKYVSHNDFKLLGKRHPLYRILGVRTSLDRYYMAYNMHNQLVYIFTWPIKKDLIANIEVSTELVEKALNDFLFKFTIIFMVILFASIMLMNLVAWSLSRPIKQLTRGVQQVSGGNFNLTLENKYNDELGDLTEQFNLMTRRIQKAQKLQLQQARIKNELEIASEIQMKLIPDHPLDYPSYRIVHHYSPAKEIGGDYYDFFPLSERKLAIILADVSGKGIPAALVVSMLKTIFQSLNNLSLSAKEVLSIANSLLRKNVKRNVFATAFYGILDMSTHKMKYAMAGSEKMLVIDNSTHKVRSEKTPGFPLGIENDTGFRGALEESVIEVKPGQGLFFYTDGLVDVKNRRGNRLEQSGIMDFLENHDFQSGDFTEALMSRTIKFRGAKEQEDDISFILVQRKP